MTVLRLLTAVAALLVSLLGASCRDRSPGPLGPEIDEPFFVEGRRLQKQDRNPEALNAFLKVIEKRGESASPESHLEAGLIFLNHSKEPIEASHHFRKYLELQPNSRQAPLVRGKLDEARREFARTVPGRPMDDQSVRLQADDVIAKLRRENDELRAELAVLRGGGAMPVNRAARMINLPVESRAAPPPVPIAPVVDSPITRAPPRTAAPTQTIQPTFKPVTPAPPVGGARGSAAVRAPFALAGRTHTVAPSDSLWKIARQHYGAATSASKVKGIYEANRNVMKNENDLKAGMTLKIP